MDIYDQSRKLAEQKLKESKIELSDLLKEEEIDLSLDEFEEDEGELPTKFEKRKAGKGDLEDSEDFAELICPFCDEIVDDLQSHIESCEFAPEDASIDDIVQPRSKRKKRGRKPAAPSKTKGKSKAKSDDEEEEDEEDEEEAGSKKCPYCGKEFQRLGRHLNSCKKKPAGENADDDDDDDDDDDFDDDDDDFDDDDF